MMKFLERAWCSGRSTQNQLGYESQASNLVSTPPTDDNNPPPQPPPSDQSRPHPEASDRPTKRSRISDPQLADRSRPSNQSARIQPSPNSTPTQLDPQPHTPNQTSPHVPSHYNPPEPQTQLPPLKSTAQSEPQEESSTEQSGSLEDHTAGSRSPSQLAAQYGPSDSPASHVQPFDPSTSQTQSTNQSFEQITQLPANQPIPQSSQPPNPSISPSHQSTSEEEGNPMCGRCHLPLRQDLPPPTHHQDQPATGIYPTDQVLCLACVRILKKQSRRAAFLSCSPTLLPGSSNSNDTQPPDGASVSHHRRRGRPPNTPGTIGHKTRPMSVLISDGVKPTSLEGGEGVEGVEAGVLPGPSPILMQQQEEEQVKKEDWVQCDRCSKWRLLPTSCVPAGGFPGKWYCYMQPAVTGSSHIHSCADPQEAYSQDWEHHYIQVNRMGEVEGLSTPQGWRREVTLRGDRSKGDVYYYAPCTKKLRSKPDLIRHFEVHPQCRAPLHQFSFTARPQDISNAQMLGDKVRILPLSNPSVKKDSSMTTSQNLGPSTHANRHVPSHQPALSHLTSAPRLQPALPSGFALQHSLDLKKDSSSFLPSGFVHPPQHYPPFPSPFPSLASSPPPPSPDVIPSQPPPRPTTSQPHSKKQSQPLDPPVAVESMDGVSRDAEDLSFEKECLMRELNALIENVPGFEEWVNHLEESNSDSRIPLPGPQEAVTLPVTTRTMPPPHSDETRKMPLAPIPEKLPFSVPDGFTLKPALDSELTHEELICGKIVHQFDSIWHIGSVRYITDVDQHRDLKAVYFEHDHKVWLLTCRLSDYGLDKKWVFLSRT